MERVVWWELCGLHTQPLTAPPIGQVQPETTWQGSQRGAGKGRVDPDGQMKHVQHRILCVCVCVCVCEGKCGKDNISLSKLNKQETTMKLKLSSSLSCLTVN